MIKSNSGLMLGINLGKPESKMNQVMQRLTKISKRIFTMSKARGMNVKGQHLGLGPLAGVLMTRWAGGLGHAAGFWSWAVQAGRLAAASEPLLQRALLSQPAATWGTRLDTLSPNHPTSENWTKSSPWPVFADRGPGLSLLPFQPVRATDSIYKIGPHLHQ